jgi:hypothetical protein
MEVTAKFESAGLSQAILKCKEHTSKTSTDFINQVALNVAGRAMNETPKADKDKIQRQLGEVGRQISPIKSGKNKGKFKRGKRIFAASNNKLEGPRAALIINARRRKAGLPGLEGKAMERAIISMVGARKRSVGFEKSGWIPAVKTLAGNIQKPFVLAQMKGISVKGTNKGSANPAKSDLVCSVLIENAAKEITRIGENALQGGMDKEAQEMERHLAAKINPIINNFNQH